MSNKKSKTRIFTGMSYREVQRANSKNKTQLYKEDINWLKENHYRNIGWDNVINLYNTINDFLEKYKVEKLSLEELFLEADRIGNKYLSSQEVENFNQKLSQEVNDIAEEVDKQFPDTEIEFIDFSRNVNVGFKNKFNKKVSRTIKF